MADSKPILGSLTMEDLGKIRKMSKPDADVYLSRHTLSDKERQYADALVGRDRTDASKMYDPTRRLWFTAAWLAGASWRQLSRLHDVAPQTIMAIVDRIMTSPERQIMRIRQSGMSLESLDIYHASFVRNLDSLKNLPPQEVAKWLLDNTELDNE